VGEVRIIGGSWRRSKLSVPDKPGLRPTPDRVRETLFNWLGQDLSGWQVFDAFAGSGALGFEAASRGAAMVRMVELDPQLVAALKGTAVRLGTDHVDVQRGDGVAALRAHARQSLDLIFLDPPFASDLWVPALQAARPCLREHGWVYLESPRAFTEEACAQWGYRLHRQLRAGQVWAHLLALGPVHGS
jgi:16S rRNA (guanine(966)-N(2))-methyltransferase RsmD